MSRQLQIDLAHREGALLRVLGTIERRGFTLLELAADKPDSDSLSLRLQFDGDRDADVLCRQLERLVEVLSVRLLPEPPPAPAPPVFQASWL